MGALRQFRIGNALVCAGIGLAGALIVLLLRYHGILQGAELYAYDKFLCRRARDAPATSDQIQLVEITENDIARFTHPLPDTKLADLLALIEKQQPVAIGLDLYRDSPVPPGGQDIAKLDSVLQANDNIICAFRFGDRDHPFEIKPLDILKDRVDDRIGFNNFPYDNKSVRRAYLYIQDAKGITYNSFAMLLASWAGVTPQPVGKDLISIGGGTVYKFTGDTGGYVNAVDGDYQMLLDFKGPRTFNPYSLEQVFDGQVPPNTFRDKIVLIGEAAHSVNDLITTPLNDLEPGVELHAWVVDQLLRMQERGDRVIQAWGPLAQSGWLFLWCAIAAGIGYHCRAPAAFITAPIGMLALLIYICWEAFQRGWWLPLIPPMAGSLPVTAMVVSYMGYREKMDRNTLMNIFCRHVSTGVANAVWEQRDLFTRDQRLIPLRLKATVLFTDLQNFSTVAEQMEPEELLAWINEYMELLVRHVERYGGMVNKYMGDSIMAVFGAPVPRTSPAEIKRDAVNAVKCALAMGAALEKLNVTRRAELRPTTNMRVGIYSGPAVSGSIGSCERLEFTVLGDTVNTASRLESFDKSLFADQTCRILLGESTRELVESDFHLKFIDTIELKGQHEKTGIYYVPRDENSEAGGLGRVAGNDALPCDLPRANQLSGSNSAA